jgi:O-antigen/teichoic acid export membrane protein
MSTRIHLRNLAFNWGGHAATMVVMFFLSPYVVGKLDAVSYGIWSLLNVLTGYMGIFDLGVRASVGRHVALYLGKEDPVGVDETIRAGFGFFSLVGVLILLVGVGLGFLFPHLFKGVKPEYYDTVRILLPLMVINVWLSAVAAIYSSVLAAHDRFDIARGVDMVVLLARTIGTVYVLEMGWGLWGLVLAVIAGNVCAVTGNRIFADRVHRGLRSFPFLYSKERLAELFSYGIPAFITSAAVKIAGQSSLVIVGIFLSVSDVREYSVGAMLIIYSTTFIKIISRTFFPAMQRAAGKNDMGEMESLLNKQLKVSLIFGGTLYIGYALYSKIFIELWMLQPSFGIESVVKSSQVMTVLAFSSLPLLIVNPCISVLASVGRIGITAKLTLVESLFSVVLSVIFVLIFNWGLVGVASGILVSRYLISTTLIPYYAIRELKLQLTGFIKSFIFPAIVFLLSFYIVCFLATKFYLPHSWKMFFVNVVAVSFCGFSLSGILLFPRLFCEKIKLKMCRW